MPYSLFEPRIYLKILFYENEIRKTLLNSYIYYLYTKKKKTKTINQTEKEITFCLTTEINYQAGLANSLIELYLLLCLRKDKKIYKYILSKGQFLSQSHSTKYRH